MVNRWNLSYVHIVLESFFNGTEIHRSFDDFLVGRELFGIDRQQKWPSFVLLFQLFQEKFARCKFSLLFLGQCFACTATSGCAARGIAASGICATSGCRCRGSRGGSGDVVAAANCSSSRCRSSGCSTSGCANGRYRAASSGWLFPRRWRRRRWLRRTDLLYVDVRCRRRRWTATQNTHFWFFFPLFPNFLYFFLLL